MHRIDGAGATGGNLFTDGNPTSGVPATVVTDDWLNAVQEEVCNVIASRGIALSKPVNTQLLAALNSMIAAAIAAIPADPPFPAIPDAIPPGAVMSFARASAPSGWLKCNGAAVSRTTYAALYTAIGGVFGTGDGSTTFNVPEMRGEFVRGWDDSRGVDGSRVFGSAQADAVQDVTGTLRLATGGVASATGPFAADGATVPHIDAGITGTDPGITFALSRVARTAAETRGRNVALLWCIKV